MRRNDRADHVTVCFDHLPERRRTAQCMMSAMDGDSRRPTLVVVSGPSGVGKTTLAHALAEEISCPAICRDEIKEGMVHAFGDRFEAAPGDELTRRAFPVFFDVLRLLIGAGASVVAEAAFQDRLWRPNLRSLESQGATIRIVRCRADSDTARARVRSRGPRAAHADGSVGDDRSYAEFDHVGEGFTCMDVDTTSGYEPSIERIVQFVNS